MASEVGEWLESDLLPSPDIVSWKFGKVEEVQLGIIEKVQHYAWNFFRFTVHLLVLPFACIYSMARYAVSLFQEPGKKAEIPKGPVNALDALLSHFGFSTSMFQDCGLGTKFTATPLAGGGTCDWDDWLNSQRIEGADENYRRFFFDILRSPQKYIDILKSQNVNAHRFSLEWAVIEPRPGEYDQEAIGLYRNFIQMLKNNGIEPYVTLHHFVCPKWFMTNGGFDNFKNIEVFKNHALKMMELFPEMTHVMPFNEINVDGFQKCARGVYPPGREGDIAGAGRMMRNMLIAHCQIYMEAKERWPEKQIGSTHQWLWFQPATGNLLEQAICYFLSKITHFACFDFFKTGQFSLEIPGVANVQLTIPKEEFEKHNGFSDFLGVQFYGLPQLMAAFNGGEEYPGFGIKNFNLPSLGIGLTFGSTCQKGGVVQSFGLLFDPESLDKCLEQAITLKKPLVITETGCDARVWHWGGKEWVIDKQAQREYFERILPILEKYREYIKGFFAWTLANGLEWERGDTPILNLGKMHKNENGIIEAYEPYPAGEFLKDIFGQKMAELQRAVAAA